MSDTKDAWDRVASSFSDLGRSVGGRFRSMSPGERDDVSKGLDKLVERLDQAFTSLGETLRDPGSKESVRKAASSLGDALTTTFEDVGERVRRRLGSSGES